MPYFYRKPFGQEEWRAGSSDLVVVECYTDPRRAIPRTDPFENIALMSAVAQAEALASGDQGDQTVREED